MRKVISLFLLTSSFLMALESNRFLSAGYGVTISSPSTVTAEATTMHLKAASHAKEGYGIEAEYISSITPFTISATDTSYSAICVLLTYQVPLSTSLNAKIRFGGSTESLATTAATTTATAASYGGQINYDFSNTFALYMDYTIVSTDISVASAGLNYKFR